MKSWTKDLREVLLLFGMKVKAHGDESEQAEGGKEPEKEPAPKRGSKRRLQGHGRGRPEDEEPPEDSIWHDGGWMNFQEYKEFRTFLFVHHFSGRTDMLRNMVLKEAEKRGIKVVVASRDIETGSDLLTDKPFGNDLIEAKKDQSMPTIAGFRALRIRDCAGTPRRATRALSGQKTNPTGWTT